LQTPSLSTALFSVELEKSMPGDIWNSHSWNWRTELRFLTWALAAGLLCLSVPCHAVELRISSEALERTLRTQLFTADSGRYYLQGNAHSACYAYAQDPSIRFVADRIVVRVQTHSRLGTSLHGNCIGVGFSPQAAVSLVPVAEGETIGFKDAHIEKVTESRELNFLLKPFLNRKVPSSLTVNAATILRQLLEKSRESTGYSISLEHLQIQSMQIVGDSLVVEIEGSVGVK
jgi:hypothetical protein